MEHTDPSSLHLLTPEDGRLKDIIVYLDEIEEKHGTLLLDNQLPSLYIYKGVAYYSARDKQYEAEQTFKQAVKYFPHETLAWMNLGEIQTQVQKYLKRPIETSHLASFLVN